MMSRRDGSMLVLLAVLAGFIWTRDLSWTASAWDTLPILLAFPLLIWFGQPWQFVAAGRRVSTSGVACAVAFLLLGIAADLTLLLTVGWTVLLWCWLSVRLTPEAKGRLRRLLVLCVLAFPWIRLDMGQLGWWFRISGTWATAGMFSIMGFDVARQGTSLLVQGMHVSVEAPCSGMNVLQSMLIAGSALAYVHLGKGRHYWWNLPLLVAMAWLANTSRIVTLCLAGLSVSPAFAMGFFHSAGGLVVLCFVFCLCWLAFSLQSGQRADATCGV